MKISRLILALVVVVLFSGVAIAQHSLRDMMQHAGATFLGLREDLGASNMDAAKMKAHDLVEVTKEIQLYWTLRNVNWQVEDGMGWARDVHHGAVQVAKELEAGNADGAGEALQTTLQGCGACHQKYRPPRRSQ